MNICIFCCKAEKGATENPFLCSFCTQVLISSTPEQIKRAYDKAVRLEKHLAVNFLKNYLEEENGKIIRQDLGRERTGRKVRPSNNKSRAQHPIRELDKGRAEVR